MFEDDTKRVTLTERMRAAREKGVVALQDYNTLRSKFPGAIVLALEGDDDPIYYKTTIKSIEPNLKWIPLVCNGKDKVLSLRVLLGRNSDSDAKNTYYFVDKDFDNLKGQPASENLYCTPGYSIESFLVSVEVFEELLIGEFKCSAGDDEIAVLKALFEMRLHEFFDAMELANRALHYCRFKGIRAGSVENNIRKYLTISLDKVSANYDQGALSQLVGFDDSFDVSILKETKVAFDKLDPLTDWRGKYALAFFVEFLTHLVEDRCCKTPRLFKYRRRVTFNPKSSIVRALSSIAPPPTCLIGFVGAITT